MSVSSEPHQWLREKEVADMIGHSIHTIRDWRAGTSLSVPPWYKIGGMILYKRSDIEAFIESCRGG